MRIIEPAARRPDGPLRGRCRGCRVLVECERAEATWLEGRAGEADACYGVRCPTPASGSWIYLREHRGA